MQIVGVKRITMLEALIVFFVGLWLLGFVAFHIATPMIHLLLLVAAVVLIMRFMRGGSGTTVP